VDGGGSGAERAVGPGESVLDVSIRSGAVGFSAGKVAAAWPEGVRERGLEREKKQPILRPRERYKRRTSSSCWSCWARKRDALPKLPQSSAPPPCSSRVPCTFRFLSRNAPRGLQRRYFFRILPGRPNRSLSRVSVSASGLKPRDVHERVREVQNAKGNGCRGGGGRAKDEGASRYSRCVRWRDF